MKSLRDLFSSLKRPARKNVVSYSLPVTDDSALAVPLMRRTPRTPPQPLPEPILRISCPDPTAEDLLRDQHQNHAQRLVRQERWDQLSWAIHTADRGRAMTPGSMPIADLMGYGARADVVMAVEHALLDGTPDPQAPLLAGIEALEHILAEFDGDPVIACIVAQAHMDIGWAWRGTGWDVEVPTRNRDAFGAHFDRARDIIDPYCSKKNQSPLLATTCCALLGGMEADSRLVSERYETLIDLNPLNPRAMRAMGNHLLPRWYGTYEALELEARRTAARTINIWGAGGYTWVMFDAVTYDDTACANLDLPFFVDGLRDILDRNPDAYTVNLLAAYCANAIGQTFSGNDLADQHRAKIAKCARWIVRDNLTELHPMIWAHAARGFDNNLRVNSLKRFAASGRDDAMRIITNLFQREIDAGEKIVFTDSGSAPLLG